MFAVVVSLETVVALVVYLIIAALVFGLLFWLTQYVESEWPGAGIFMKFARVVLVVFAVLALIVLLLNFVGYSPLVSR